MAADIAFIALIVGLAFAAVIGVLYVVARFSRR
jgi:hypothetical protein